MSDKTALGIGRYKSFFNTSICLFKIPKQSQNQQVFETCALLRHSRESMLLIHDSTRVVIGINITTLKTKTKPGSRVLKTRIIYKLLYNLYT